VKLKLARLNQEYIEIRRWVRVRDLGIVGYPIMVGQGASASLTFEPHSIK
jgi:hypothetical protein